MVRGIVPKMWCSNCSFSGFPRGHEVAIFRLVTSHDLFSILFINLSSFSFPVCVFGKESRCVMNEDYLSDCTVYTLGIPQKLWKFVGMLKGKRDLSECLSIKFFVSFSCSFSSSSLFCSSSSYSILSFFFFLFLHFLFVFFCFKHRTEERV